MIDKNKLDALIENKNFEEINLLLFNEFKILFGKITETEQLNLSFTSLISLMKDKHPEVSKKLDFLYYILSDENLKNHEQTYNLLNLYINFVKFYSL